MPVREVFRGLRWRSIRERYLLAASSGPPSKHLVCTGTLSYAPRLSRKGLRPPPAVISKPSHSALTEQCFQSAVPCIPISCSGWACRKFWIHNPAATTAPTADRESRLAWTHTTFSRRRYCSSPATVDRERSAAPLGSISPRSLNFTFAVSGSPHAMQRGFPGIYRHYGGSNARNLAIGKSEGQTRRPTTLPY